MTFVEPEGEFIRRRQVSGTTHATMRTVLDYARGRRPSDGRARGRRRRRFRTDAAPICARRAVRMRSRHLPGVRRLNSSSTMSALTLRPPAPSTFAGAVEIAACVRHFQTVRLSARVVTSCTQEQLDGAGRGSRGSLPGTQPHA